MKKARLRARMKASVPKRPKPRRGKARFFTRADARRRAERHVLKRMFKGATVQDGAKVSLGMYCRGGWTAEDVWVVYKNPEQAALKSSEVVLVSKRTGRVVYEGSAGDEG